MNDPFNCPQCGAHDYGLVSPGLKMCPRCMDKEIERLLAENSDLKDAVSVLRQDFKELQGHDRKGQEDLAEADALLDTKSRELAAKTEELEQAEVLLRETAHTLRTISQGVGPSAYYSRKALRPIDAWLAKREGGK